MFTNLARIVAIGALVFGAFGLLFGLAIASELLGSYEAAAARYGKSGKMIDGGIRMIVVAIALGTLAEISLAVRKRVSY